MNPQDGTFDPYYKWLGIAPTQQPPHHYRLLGIELFEEDLEVIAAAADRQMAHVRTFQTGPHAACSQRILNELAAARLCLLDPHRKREYDAELRGRLAAQTHRSDAWGQERSGGPPPAEPAHKGADLSWIRLVPLAIRYLRFEAQRLWLQHSRLPALYWQIGLARYQAGRHDRGLAGLSPPPYEAVARVERLATRKRQNLWRTLGRLWRAGVEHRRRALALQRLGHEAVAEEGPPCAPPTLTDPLQDLLDRLSSLRAEIDHLAEVPPGQFLGPRRLAWLVLIGLAGLATLLWSWFRPW